MKLRLLDYSGKSTEFEIGPLSDITTIYLDIVTGDEIAHITFKNGQTRSYDTGIDRFFDCYDDSYIVYDSQASINLFEDERWMNRKDSYYDLFNFNEEV